MNIISKIERLILENNLGNKINNIDKVTGGLSHRMYKVETDKGIYAVKELNSGVMKREKAYANFGFSEKVTDIAKENGISAIGALKFNNDIMLKIDDSYFMVFEWLEGKILKAEEITDKHCESIGNILAQIHNIDFSKIEDDERKNIETDYFDWKKYVIPAEEEIKKNYPKRIKNYVAIEDNKVVGTISIDRLRGDETGKKYIILTLFVKLEKHNQGIGTTLIKKIEEYAKTINAKEVYIPASIYGCEFYRKLGYDYLDGKKEQNKDKEYTLVKYL